MLLRNRPSTIKMVDAWLDVLSTDSKMWDQVRHCARLPVDWRTLAGRLAQHHQCQSSPGCQLPTLTWPRPCRCAGRAGSTW